ncbi:gas vesicle protein GvpO, halophile-type [Halalkalicoccus salilacus]|uniref:gas vesicle protein GvpO, halophile-type n=1 Tax=Halalkalicoccus TaxID=332246 RepID=UPI002F96591B
MSASDEQCKALTGSGERCTRPVQSDGYCYQHGPDDETVDEETEETTTDEGEDQKTSMSDDDSNIDDTEIGQIRNKVRSIAEEVVGYPLSGILAIDREDDGWRVAVEMIERSSVPDTQDILGRYEITLDEDRTVTGYRRTHRYRRDDMEQDI